MLQLLASWAQLCLALGSSWHQLTLSQIESDFERQSEVQKWHAPVPGLQCWSQSLAVGTFPKVAKQNTEIGGGRRSLMAQKWLNFPRSDDLFEFLWHTWLIIYVFIYLSHKNCFSKVSHSSWLRLRSTAAAATLQNVVRSKFLWLCRRRHLSFSNLSHAESASVSASISFMNWCWMVGAKKKQIDKWVEQK